MPGIDQQQANPGPGGSALSEGDSIFKNLRALRDQIIIAWRERAVILSPEEQTALKAEIKQTCQFLTDLTHPGETDRTKA